MAVTNGVLDAKITVVSSGTTYSVYSDWGLIIENGDPIGDPEQETNYINVMGRNNLLDASEVLTGRPTFKGRPINMQVAFDGEPERWTVKIPDIRNKINGRQVKIRFSDDTSHYWLGRISVKDTERAKRLGRFTLAAYVDAYKHEIASSQEKLRWDDMNFLTDCLRYLGTVTITDSGTITIPHGEVGVVPVITVSNLSSGSLTMHSSSNNTTYTLVTGRNRFPDLLVCGTANVTLTFTGSAKVAVDYRGESL